MVTPWGDHAGQMGGQRCHDEICVAPELAAYLKAALRVGLSLPYMDPKRACDEADGTTAA